MRIFNVGVILDGGTTRFQIERDGNIKKVCLKSHYAGEPRPLLINEIPISRGDSEVTDLLKDIEEWRSTLSESLRTESESLVKVNPKIPNGILPSSKSAIDETVVVRVRDYVTLHYLD